MLSRFFSKGAKAPQAVSEKNIGNALSKGIVEQPMAETPVENIPTVLTVCNHALSMCVITRDTCFEGTLTIAGEQNGAQIEGTFIGDIISTGHIKIGKGGAVDGTIHTSTLEIAGTLTGQADVAKECAVSSTGRIEGNILTGSLNINGGAIINGTIQMQHAEKPEP